MRELDLLLQGFLECGYADLDESARAAFATLLDYPDALLFDYLLGKSHPSDRAIADVINRIRSAAVS
jgi:antitoxin CptB